MTPFDHGFTVTIDGADYRVSITRSALEGIAADPKGVPSATLFERHRESIERYASELIRTAEPRADGVYVLTEDWIFGDVEDDIGDDL